MKRLIAILLLALLFGGGVAFAQSATAAQPAANGGWQQVNGDMLARGESIPASRLVGAAYGFLFVAIVVWVVSVARRARRLEDEVAALQKKLEGSRG